MNIVRRPAYARQLDASLSDGQEPRDILIFIDQAPPEKPVRPVLAVFSDADPTALDWSQVTGRDVLVVDADKPRRDRLRSTVQAIVAAGPRRLVLLIQRPPFAEYVIVAGLSDD